MDSNHLNNRQEHNQHWFCNPDPITGYQQHPKDYRTVPDSLLYPPVDNFDHSALMNMNMNNGFIDGNYYVDPYLDSAMMNLNPYLTHDPHVHHNLLTNHPLAETHSSNLDFPSFEELFPLLDEDLNLQLEMQQPPNMVDGSNASNIGNYSTDSSKNYSDNYKVDADVIEIEDNVDADDDSYADNVDARYVDDDDDQEKTKTNTKKKNKGPREGKSKASLIGFEDVSKHFDVPITKAAKRLNVGLTALKKRCRELNIERWPHRKIQSLNSLIHSLQDDAGLRDDVEKLKEHKKVMVEKMPDMELTLETKRLRQACFKVNYKKRKSSYMTMAAAAAAATSSSSSSSYYPHFKRSRY